MQTEALCGCECISVLCGGHGGFVINLTQNPNFHLCLVSWVCTQNICHFCFVFCFSLISLDNKTTWLGLLKGQVLQYLTLLCLQW